MSQLEWNENGTVDIQLESVLNSIAFWDIFTHDTIHWRSSVVLEVIQIPR